MTWVLNLAVVDLAGTFHGSEAVSAIKDDGSIAMVVVLPILLGLVALVVLLAGVARAGWAGWWLPAAGAVSVVLDQATSESGNALVLSAAFLPMAVALVTVGLRLTSSASRAGTAPALVPAVA